jgi:hypothetical protein
MPLPKQYTQDKSIVTLIMSGPPDRDGRRLFEAIWWQENFHAGPSWRAQMFRANPEVRIRHWEERGQTVQIIEEKP